MQRTSTPAILATLIFLSFPIAVGLANSLLLLFVLAWVISGQYPQRWLAIKANPVPLIALLLYGIVLLGVGYSDAPAQDIATHLNKYSKLAIVALVFSVLGDQAWQRRCMQAFGAAMLFILLSTWLNLWFVLPWSVTQTTGWGNSHHVIGDYITQNVMMSFFVLLCLTYARGAKTLMQRLAWLAVALLAAVSITHLSQGRTGYLLLVAIVIVFTLSALEGKARWLLLAVCIVALGIALTSSELMMQRFQHALAEAGTSADDNQTSIGHRLYNYKKSAELIAEKPLLGWGTGAYHTQICRIVEEPEWCPIFRWHPHNQFLFFGVEHGLLGMLVYAALMVSMVWLARRDKDVRSRTLLLGLTVMLLVNSMVNSPLWSSRENHFFALMMALLAAQSGVALRRNPVQDRT